MDWLRETQTWHLFAQWEDPRSDPLRARGACGTIVAVGKKDGDKWCVTDEGELPTTHLTCITCSAMVANDDY